MRLIVVAALLLAAVESHAQAESRCRDTVGFKLAERLASQCRMVSPATHPPCGVNSSCNDILSEIRRGCLYISGNEEPVPVDRRALFKNSDTAFCVDFVEIADDIFPSFDCKKAATQAERAICGDRELAGLDVWLARDYAAALKTEATTQADQRAWVKRRDAACSGPEILACLRKIMTERIDELRDSEKGLGASNAEPSSLIYSDLIGTWRVDAVRVFDDGITAVVDDDPEYMNAIVEFAATTISWTKGSDQNELSDSDNCKQAPVLRPLPENVDDALYPIPGGSTVRCGDAGWGPGDGAVVKRISAKTVRLYWFDGAILTLRPVTPSVSK